MESHHLKLVLQESSRGSHTGNEMPGLGVTCFTSTHSSLARASQRAAPPTVGPGSATPPEDGDLEILVY